MTGREESRQKVEQQIQTMLIGQPDYVSDFYYNLSIGKEPKTCRLYIGFVIKFLHQLSQEKVDDINLVTTLDVSRYMASIKYKECTRDGKTVKVPTSYSHQATVWSGLTSFSKFLVASKKIKEDFMSNIERPKASNDEIHQVIMDEQEVSTVLKASKEGVGTPRAKSKQKNWSSRDSLILSMLVTTGMRVNTLYEINVEDFTDDFKKLTTIEKGHKHVVYEIPENLIPKIKEWLKDREALLGDKTCDALFISNNRKRMCVNAIRNIVKKYTVDVDKHITPHKFRSTFCSMLYSETKDIYFTQRAMHHSSPTITERYIVDETQSERVSQIINDKIKM